MRAEPLTVTARLMTPPACDRALFLDALLYAAVGETLGREAPGGWADVPEDPALPLARVETPAGWWWAASAVTPWGPEAQAHTNRVPALEAYDRWTSARSVNVAAGPDKRLRVPHYYRPAMTTLRWTCVGDYAGVRALLPLVLGVGRLRGHGYGWVAEWRVERGGPSADAYATDLGLRHIPAALDVRLPARASRRQIPLRPPYHDRARSVPCWQVQP